MTTLVNNTKTYAVVAAMKSTPHIKDQKATGRPKGITAIGRSTTGVGAIKPTTDRLYQGTTGSSMGETKAQKTQPQDKAKAKLRKALYEIFNVKEPTIMKQEDPIEVNATCYSGGRYSTSMLNHPQIKTMLEYGGHKHAPPPVTDCLAYFILPFLFRLFVPIPSVTPGRVAHCLHTYLWTALAFSRDFHTCPPVSVLILPCSATFS